MDRAASSRTTSRTREVDPEQLEAPYLDALIEYYEARGLLRRFDGSRRPEEVHDLIRATLGMLRFEEKL